MHITNLPRPSLVRLALGCLCIGVAAARAQLQTPTYGWNLGNALEAPGGVGTWAPAPTPALITAVAAAGFNTIRVPCAWDCHADPKTHRIDPTYLAQVKQVVDWCYARKLTVIINDHWDGGWLTDHITATVDPGVNEKVRSYWTQIADAFRGYDSRLLFAASNEPAVTTAPQMAALTTYYETFVRAVRATGGDNVSRWLVIQGPGGGDINVTHRLMTRLPTDPTPGRLVVEVHYYDPYQYTLMPAAEWWGTMAYFWGKPYHSTTLAGRNATWGGEASVTSQFEKMVRQFVSKGIPVLLGEFGAVRRTGEPDLTGRDLALHLASRTYFDQTVVTAANRLGLRPVYWDDGGTNLNSFGLFDRRTAALVDSASARALTGGAALPPPDPAK